VLGHLAAWALAKSSDLLNPVLHNLFGQSTRRTASFQPW
jgi:hypothetical protein